MRLRVKEGQGPGAQKLRTMILEDLKRQGIAVDSEQIVFWTKKGSHRHGSGARWGGSLRIGTLLKSFSCLDTMTACINHGITVVTSPFADYQIHCKEHHAKTG